VEVYGRETVVFFDAHGIEMARHRLAEVDAPFAAGFLYGTVTHASRTVCGEHTVAAVDDACHQVAFAVDVSHAVFFNFPTGRRKQVVPYFRQYFFDFFDFGRSDRGACIAVDTALPQTFLEVAAEKALDKVEAYKSVLNL